MPKQESELEREQRAERIQTTIALLQLMDYKKAGQICIVMKKKLVIGLNKLPLQRSFY